MHKLDLVKETFDNLYSLLKEINLLGSDLLYLHGEDGSKIHPDLIQSPLLLRFQESHKMKFTLELCNYIEYKGDLSIIKFLNRLASQHTDSEWKYLITQQNIRDILSNTIEIKRSVAIATLLRFRDKEYAHKDRRFRDTDLRTSLLDVLKQVRLLNEDFESLGRKLFNGSYPLTPSDKIKDHEILEGYSRHLETKKLISIASNRRAECLDIHEIQKEFKKYDKDYF